MTKTTGLFLDECWLDKISYDNGALRLLHLFSVWCYKHEIWKIQY